MRGVEKDEEAFTDGCEEPGGWKKARGLEHATCQKQRTVVENMRIPFSISESSWLVASSQLVDRYSECSPYECNKI